MKKITHSSKVLNISRMLSRSFLVSTLATIGLFAGSIVFSSKADAQIPTKVGTNEIVKYSQALLTIEETRLQAFEDIKKIGGGEKVPTIVCNQPSSIQSLRTRRARDIARKYCQRSQKIVEESGLSIQRFNNITLKLRNDESLKRQIHNTLIRLQKKPNNP